VEIKQPTMANTLARMQRDDLVSESPTQTIADAPW
jgi:hypothetical protein